jgi:exopolyphosphatase/guanosine-5'-triphosphate,3'-diphosphate pyrophosphatase
VRKAVIDVGSNSVLLLVEEFRESRWHFVHESTAVTALGEGVKNTGVLSEAGMSATLKALDGMFATARDLGAEPEAWATMAARIARNTDDFQARCSAQKTPVSVLSGEDEARLGFDAVAHDPLFAKSNRLAIIDPGGNSTELVIAQNADEGWHKKFLRSFPIGTLGLKSDVIPAMSPGPDQILAATQRIDDAVTGVPSDDSATAVVLGATGTNLVSIREKLASWQPEKVHGSYLLFEEISRAVGWMMPMTDTDRRAIVGMEPGREKTIHIGALILERFLHALCEEGCFVSVRGWRYALLESGTRIGRVL